MRGKRDRTANAHDGQAEEGTRTFSEDRVERERGAGANKRWTRNKGALYPIRAGPVVRHH